VPLIAAKNPAFSGERALSFRATTCNTTKEPHNAAKEPHNAAKEPHNAAKEPYLSGGRKISFRAAAMPPPRTAIEEGIALLYAADFPPNTHHRIVSVPSCSTHISKCIYCINVCMPLIALQSRSEVEYESGLRARFVCTYIDIDIYIYT